MTSSTKAAKAILKAATLGDEKKLQELLASGAPLEATDVNKRTPVMLAAQAGQLGAFQMLVKAGAELHGLALCETDLLECAAEGGNVEIVQYLLGQEHPVDGHFKPTSKVDIRMGHMTPLFVAAINGHVDAVRLLLQAGANREAKFDGETTLKVVQGNIKHPLESEVALVPQFKAIAALLMGDSSTQQDPLEEEVKRFAANARRPEYKELLKSLTARFGKPVAWKPLPDHGLPAKNVVRFIIQGDTDLLVARQAQLEARQAGSHLLIEQDWEPGEKGAMALFPSDDSLAVVTAIGTEGANHSVHTADIVSWLKELSKENPFELVCCTHDLVAGKFHRALKAPKKVAAKIADLCPGCLDEEAETIDQLATQLKKKNGFMLWWD